MKIGDICEFKINMEDADFWIKRKGSEHVIGKPIKEYSPEDIGVKVIETDLIDPGYLYYAFMYLHQKGEFTKLAKGTLKLKHISIADIKNIELVSK
jgi:hypothetical protein